MAAANEIRKGTMDFAPQVKGMEIPAYDPRSGQGTALSYARCERGADHLKPWVRPGARCVVPLGNSRATGFVTALDPEAEVPRVRDLIEVLDIECVHKARPHVTRGYSQVEQELWQRRALLGR